MNIILHLGLPKTGSTFLQTEVFKHLKNVNILFNFRFVQEAYDDWLYDTIQNINKPMDMNEVKKRLPDYLVDNMPNFVSEETFYCGAFGMFRKEDNRFIVLDRINKIFPKAKIVLAIRNKKTLLVSWYKQYVAAGGVFSFEKFIEDVMNFDKLNYEKYIKKLEELYGKENLLIYTFEDLSENTHQIIKKICDFIGCAVPEFTLRKRNVGYGSTELKASLILNRFFKTRVHKNGIPYPVTYILLPHRIIFQNRLFRWIPRQDIKLDDLINSKETEKRLESFLNMD